MVKILTGDMESVRKDNIDYDYDWLHSIKLELDHQEMSDFG